MPMPAKRRSMIEESLMLNMMIKYIEQNGIKAIMRLLLRAIESTREPAE